MATYEQRLGAWMGAGFALFIAVVALHWWQDALLEDQRWINSCHTMDNRRCGPGEPWIKIQIGGTD